MCQHNQIKLWMTEQQPANNIAVEILIIQQAQDGLVLGRSHVLPCEQATSQGGKIALPTLEILLNLLCLSLALGKIGSHIVLVPEVVSDGSVYISQRRSRAGQML